MTESNDAGFANGRMKSMEYAVRMLISAHPDPELLSAIWTGMLPTILDEHTTHPSFQEEGFRTGFQRGMALWSVTVENARVLRTPRG